MSSFAVDIGLGSGIWFYSNGLGTYYTITDSSGLKTLYLGTMCSDEKGNRNTNGMCDIELDPGCYVFRVDGAFNPDVDEITWEFCGAQGGAKTQLNFCVDNNIQCKAKNIKTAEEICSNTEADVSSTTVTLAGTFDLGGLKVAELSEKDTAVIHTTLFKELCDASGTSKGKDAVEITKLSWTAADSNAFEMASNKLSEHQRKLDNIKFKKVSFEVQILAERFGVKELDEAGLSHLHLHVKHYLSRSMTVGIFLSKLLTEARLVHSTNLESVNFAQLGALKVTRKSIINNEVSILTTSVIIFSAMIGIAFSYKTYKSMTIMSNDEYDQAIPESQHDLTTPEDITSCR